ncbi:TPA: hypothetical protein ACF3I9_002138 [Klebsiella aerogenes]
MSQYGVQLINKYNMTVATADDVNYTLVSSGQLYQGSFYDFQGAKSLKIDVTGLNAPLLFLVMDSNNKRLSQIPACSSGSRLNAGDGAWTKYIQVYKWGNLNFDYVQYYLFDRWIPPERSTYGLQIFDGGGGIIFDGGWNFLKIRDVIWMDPGYPNHANDVNGSNWTMVGNVGGGNWALSMPFAREWTYYDGVYSYRLNECSHTDGAGNIFCSLVKTGDYYDIYPYNDWIHRMRSQIMVCDVTGLPNTLNPRALS